ncbi:MAG: hypothetical protein KAJ18_04740 [Candidatus Omnitrophica bacterium]|nr:hypothetical protein [Candidatus Omnitrophota bacterium]
MGTFISIMMYVLWTATIVAVLAATFTNFRYEDLNLIAFVLAVFVSLNSFLIITRKKQ